MLKIEAHEYEIKGIWVSIDSILESNAACRRIKQLTSEYLIQIKTDETGWETLFQEADDKRYW